MKEVEKYLEENFNEEKVTSMLDDEILNWVDSDWENDGDYDCEYDWYISHGRNSAEDVIIKEITDDVMKQFPEKEMIEVYDLVKSSYDCLDYYD